jgi:hypothetical protein
MPDRTGRALGSRIENVAGLAIGSQRILIDESRHDLADRGHKLFRETFAGDETSSGMTEFTSNLSRTRVIDAKGATQNPNAHRSEVEDAMLVTLKENAIPLSQGLINNFKAVNSGFQPKLPMATTALTPPAPKPAAAEGRPPIP